MSNFRGHYNPEMLRSNSISLHGAYLFQILGQYADVYPAAHPRVYQVDELYLLHSAKGSTSYVVPPTTADIGLPATPPNPLPISLFITTQNDQTVELDVHIASGKEYVWIVNPVIPRLSVYDGPANLRHYRPGDIYTDEKRFPGFSLDLSALFNIAPASLSHLSTEDQSLLRLLLYPIIFEVKPLDALERVIDMLNKNSSLPRDAVLEAVQHALASRSFSISTILDFVAPEDEIRAFLQEFQRHLRPD
ncbi:MAG TPA: hypothetical protein PLQ56_27420 [Aggregatilineales bacterium]|nr:hypothetical protein [Aggregatilineales bacterium]